jgi:hypothetical protein
MTDLLLTTAGSSIAPTRIIVSDLSDDEQEALDALLTQWRAKRPRNNLRSGFYDMKNSYRTLMASTVPEVVKRRSFVLGWSAMAVDKLNRRCNLEGFYDAAGTDLDNLGLSTLVRDNRLTSEVNQAGSSSLIHAVSFLVTTQGGDGEPEVLITAKSAGTATGFWDRRLRRMTSFLSIHDLDERGEPTSMTMMLHNLNILLTRENGRWSADHKPHAFGVPVDPMRYQYRVDRPLGRSRITRAVMSFHSQALGAMIRADVNGEAYSLARYVLLGATEEAFRNADGSPKAAWQAAWDAVWAVGDDPDAPSDALARADVKQFTGQSPEPQNAHLRMLAQMFAGETSISIGELGIIGDSNPTSAEALEVSRDDLINEAGQTTEGWSPDVASAVRRGLAMLNGDDLPADLDVRCHWRKPMYVSSSAAADAGSKIIDKAPWLAETEVGLELMGLSPDQIKRALAEKRRTQGSATLADLRERMARRADPDAATA